MKNRKIRSIYTQFRDNRITDETLFFGRRRLVKSLAVCTLGIGGLKGAFANVVPEDTMGFKTGETLSSEYVVTHYNNFYEFSTSKDKPAELAKHFNPGNDWKISVSGHVENSGEYSLGDILSWVNIEERIYRLRCVEAWSMVVPWQGFQLSQLISRLKPTTKAKFIEFKTLESRTSFPGQKRGSLGFNVLPWPYREGLRLDEAFNPLSFVATGVYGKKLPGQNGAPLRLVIPWKYGFKNIKSIVSIRFLDSQPTNTWHKNAPREYGFYANVNPQVDHPRWSQARERRILDESLFGVKKIKTRMFNGYAEQVSTMYAGMDLARNY